MALPRTFVGFSGTDIGYYRLMLAWKAHEKIDFDFCDCQLRSELNSENEQYIKRRCRERINMAGTYVLLIGADTRYKHKYVRWEAEVAREKGCRVIGVNLDGWRRINDATWPGVDPVSWTPDDVGRSPRWESEKDIQRSCGRSW